MSQAVAVAASPAPEPNWHHIQSLYLQGVSPKEIERQTGVSANRVSARALRYGWSEALRKARASVSVTIETTQKVADKAESSLNKSSEAVRAGLADVLTRSVEKIQAMGFKTPAAALKVNAELESVVRNAKVVFGWSESSTQPLVRIDIMNNALSLSEQANVPRLEQAQAPVIDITPVPPSA